MIKTVYFDIGNVLIFFSLPKMVEQLSSCTGLHPTAIQKGFFETDMRERYEKGLINTEQLYHFFQEKGEKRFSLSEFRAAFADIFTLNTELLPIVKALKKEKIELILLSNTSPCHFEYIRQSYPVIQLFDQQILSYELGTWKPDLRIFQEALKVTNASPEECFYTDDIPEFVAQARSVGLPAEVFTTAAACKEHLIARGCTFL